MGRYKLVDTNIKKGFNSIVNEKIDYIVSLCQLLGLDFNNTIPNKYTVNSTTGSYVFGTYSDVINALEMLKRESK